MTRRELVIEAMEHRETAVIPHHMEFTRQALEKLIAYTKDANIEEKLNSCLHYIQYWGWPTELEGRPGHFKDEFGVVWNRSGADKDIGVVDAPQYPNLEDAEIVLPECDVKRLRAEYERLVAAKADRFTFAGFGFCMFERVWSLMGMENALVSMITCPAEMEALYDKLADYYLRLIDIALEYDIDAVYFGDDWGQQRGLIMGPEHWRRFIKPHMKKLYAKVKGAGKYVIQHSCGDCHELFPDLIDIGLDCYQTFQPEIYDIEKMKALYGSSLCFWGGISTQECLPFATADGVRREVVRIANALRKNGGLILAPTHAITFDIPPENILAMDEVFRNQAKYL